MSEIKHIRKRISARRKTPGPRAYEAPGSPLFTLIYGLAMLAMVGASLGLGWMINEKQQWVDPKPVLQQIEVLSEKLHLKSLSAWLPFEKWFGKEQPVAAPVSYELIQDHYYKPASGNQVQSIADGVVLYIGEQESGAIVMVKQDNGVLVTYGALQEVQVHLNDRILKGTALGAVQDAVYLEFSEQGQPVTLERAIGNAG